MSTPTPELLAARLAEAERTATPIAPFAEIPPGDIAAAYAVQQASLARWLADGRRIVAEGSQNLRRCHCHEQVVISDDAALWQFYAAFIEGMSE